MLKRFESDFYTDIQWLHRISFKLELFARKSSSSHLYACRCPICGDSKKKKRLTRFFFYEKERSLFAQCKNCGYSRTFFNFMRDVFTSEFDEYKKDQLKANIDSIGRYSKKEEKECVNEKPESVSVSKGDFLSNCISLRELPVDHFCVKYVKSRKLPFDKLFFTNNFKELANEISAVSLSEDFPSDQRLIIPFFSSDGETLEMCQGRSLSKKSRMRYLTIKAIPDADKIYGKNDIDRSKTVYCVEGPLDSMFIDNCLATCDSSLTRADADVYIYDNEPRNRDIVESLEKTIEQGKKVVVWPISPDKKIDINDMILMGLTKTDIMNIIVENTCSGPLARLKLLKWRKV